jgi:tRNA pseudouridine38-40 synthase
LPVWKLTVEYEGTRYHGWQEQRGARTIAGEIRASAEKFFGSRVEISGSGRTDAGVHALAQVARLSGARRVKPDELQRAINDQLPADINVLRIEPADARFDPRRDAVCRYYVYQISTRRTAFAKKFVWWVRDSLDVGSMSEAAQLLVGRHDFAPFCERREDDRSTTVVVDKVRMSREGDLILFRIGASHFLWKMVRRIVGALVEVGRGALDVDAFGSLLDRPVPRGSTSDAANIARFTAPPSGLFLERVAYRRDERPAELQPVFPVTRFE